MNKKDIYMEDSKFIIPDRFVKVINNYLNGIKEKENVTFNIREAYESYIEKDCLEIIFHSDGIRLFLTIEGRFAKKVVINIKSEMVNPSLYNIGLVENYLTTKERKDLNKLFSVSTVKRLYKKIIHDKGVEEAKGLRSISEGIRNEIINKKIIRIDLYDKNC